MFSDILGNATEEKVETDLNKVLIQATGLLLPCKLSLPGVPKMPFTLAPEELLNNNRLLSNLKDDV